MLSGEAANTEFTVFCLTRLGLEPTRDEHATNYTTDAIRSIKFVKFLKHQFSDNGYTLWANLGFVQLYIEMITFSCHIDYSLYKDQ